MADLAIKLAPFAPADAAASVDAILLLQSPPLLGSGGTMSASAMFANTAPVSASSGPYPSSGSGRMDSGRQDAGGPRTETRPAWQRTSAGDTVSRGGGGRGLAITALGLVLAAATAGTYLLLGHAPGSGALLERASSAPNFSYPRCP